MKKLIIGLPKGSLQEPTYSLFKKAGFNIKHLDNTTTKKQRLEILSWFKNTENAILTSVSILTTGFDEPSVKCIMINRATKSLTLYYQMIGRGSRLLKLVRIIKIIKIIRIIKIIKMR